MKKALFVGVDDYKDPQIRNLSFSLADAFSLNAVFENLGYDTKVLANPTRLDLITAIRECNQSLKQGDSFFFYFAGHGWTTTGGVHLLFCSDDVYDPNGNFNAGVSFGGLKAETTGNGYNRAFVLDACRSHFLEGARDVVDNTTRDLRPIGELLEEDNQQNNAGSLAVIRSCSQNEHAIEIAAAQHGLFTLAMQSVMRGAIQEGRQLSFGTEFCSEITAEMRAFANKHKILNTQTPEFAMAGERQVLIPGQPRNNRENAPIYYSCPICGKNNLVTETFNCKKCSTEYLCLSHKSQELGICEKCYSTTVSQPPPAPRDINKVKCADIPDQILKKGLACPECHLFDEALDCALVKGKDYVVQYEDADSPGFATVVITGIGEYCGEKRVQFEIKKEETPKPTPTPLKKIPCNQFEDYEGVYDGKNHGLGLIENACVSEIDAQLTWFNNKTKSWEKKFPGFVDVCDRTFTVKITAPGYAEHTELRRIRILPKPLSLDMVENVSFSEYEDGDGGFITSRLKMKDVEPCVIQDKDWAIVETGTKTDLIVVTGRGNYCGMLEIKIKEDKNSAEDFSVGSPPSKQGRKWRAWLQLLGSLLLLVALWAPIDWSGILSFNSDFDKGENQFSDSYENVTSPGWGFNPTPCKAPDYVDGERYKDGDCRTFTLPVKAKYPDGVHSVKMEMVYVAPGEFNMGSSEDDVFFAPIHPVKITKGYWIGKYPVTQAQWVTLIAYSKLKLKNDRQWFCSVGGGKDYVKGLDTSDFPMESISWNDCDALVKALNSNETFSVEWMIPTEAQWEFAAKGGNKSKGYKFSGCDDIDMVGWYKNNSGGRTHSVLEKVKGNELGIVGMSGNVREWCRDFYQSGYYDECKVKGMVEDPCNVAASGVFRVLRGGSWISLARNCRSANRDGGRPGDRNNSYGFRLACSAGLREEVSDSANKKKSTAELEINTNAAIQAFNRKDYAEFWRLVECANKNDARVIRCLGDAYCLKGRKGEKINWEHAVEQYEKLITLVDATERGDLEARIAGIYLTKILNRKKGYEYARASARNGSLRGWSILGACYRVGFGCSIDYYAAIDCFEKGLTMADATGRDIANRNIKELKEEVAKIENVANEFVMAFANQDTNKLSKLMFDWDKHSGLIEQEFVLESAQEIKNKKFAVRLNRYRNSDRKFIKEKAGLFAEAYDTSLWLGSERLSGGPDVLVKFIDGEFKASIVNLQGWE